MPFFILIAFLLLPLIEIASIIQVGRWIGVLPTLALLVAFACLGLYLIRSQSILLSGRLVEAMRQGVPPEKPLLDSGVVSFAGILFMIPGFITDIFALLLLIPLARRQIWRGIAFVVRSRFRTREASAQREKSAYSRRDDVIDVEYTEVPPESDRKPHADKRESPWRRSR